MAASNSVNGLASLVAQWLENNSAGRSVYDDTVQKVVLYQLDPEQGNYMRSQELLANSRKDIIRKIRALGAR